MDEEPCAICGRPLLVPPEVVSGRDAFRARCRSCGDYVMTGPAEATLLHAENYRNDRYRIAAAVRRVSDGGGLVTVSTHNLDSLRDSIAPPKTPFHGMDRIVLHLVEKMQTPDGFVQLFPEDYPISHARNEEEFAFYLEKLEELRRLERDGGGRVRLTLDGWRYAEQLHRDAGTGDQAFVAMWFDDSMKEAWEAGFKPALEAVGFRPVRIDAVEHTDKIDDRIIAEIRGSSLVVADFTGHRGGVYFEAGFALGLDKPVVWTCREDAIGDAHFDTRQYNHLLWKDPLDLRRRLEARILAVYPSRPR